MASKIPPYKDLLEELKKTKPDLFLTNTMAHEATEAFRKFYKKLSAGEVVIDARG